MPNIRASLIIAILGSISGLAAAHFGSPAMATETTSMSAIGYRAQGYGGIEKFLKINGGEMARLRSQPNNPRGQKLNRELDAICKQRDCYASRLFWHTDFAQAKQAAQASGKPILSLRLLGNLDEDLSCANSRFFRITLYSHPEIAQLLRDKYILHWESVRPVPKITIDFGDGRKVQQTLTGNSIHYILDKDGRPIDALPGLYAPQAFKRQLVQGAAFVAKFQQLPEQQRQKSIEQYHQTQLTTLQTNWKKDLDKLGINIPISTSIGSFSNPPTAAEAAPIAISKMAIESPIIERSRAFSRRGDILKQATDEPLWAKLGEMHREDATLAKNSLELIRNKQPQLSSLTSPTQDQMPKLVNRFQKLIAIDSIRNEYLLHSQIHQWLLGSRFPITDVESLNTRVYDQLFLTPKSDPWLRLMPNDGYSGIDRDGVN